MEVDMTLDQITVKATDDLLDIMQTIKLLKSEVMNLNKIIEDKDKEIEGLTNSKTDDE